MIKSSEIEKAKNVQEVISAFNVKEKFDRDMLWQFIHCISQKDIKILTNQKMFKSVKSSLMLFMDIYSKFYLIPKKLLNESEKEEIMNSSEVFRFIFEKQLIEAKSPLFHIEFCNDIAEKCLSGIISKEQYEKKKSNLFKYVEKIKSMLNENYSELVLG